MSYLSTNLASYSTGMAPVPPAIAAIHGSTTPNILPAAAATTTTTASASPTPAPAATKRKRNKDDLDDEELNSDDDELSEDNIVDSVAADVPPPNIVVSFYEKVCKQLENLSFHSKGQLFALR